MDPGRCHDLRQEYGAARYYYSELVKQYADTPFADTARERIEAMRGKPDQPPQRLSWLVKLFPETEPAKPMIVTFQSAIKKR